jgi:hypothetical protein
VSTLEEELRTRLLADTAIAGLVVDRIMPDIALADLTTFPIIVYGRLNSQEEYDLEGNPYKESARIEYSCIDKTWVGARQLLELVRTKALASRGLYNGIMIAAVFVADVREKGYSKLTKSYQIDLDLEVHRIF